MISFLKGQCRILGTKTGVPSPRPELQSSGQNRMRFLCLKRQSLSMAFAYFCVFQIFFFFSISCILNLWKILKILHWPFSIFVIVCKICYDFLTQKRCWYFYLNKPEPIIAFCAVKDSLPVTHVSTLAIEVHWALTFWTDMATGTKCVSLLDVFPGGFEVSFLSYVIWFKKKF